MSLFKPLVVDPGSETPIKQLQATDDLLEIALEPAWPVPMRVEAVNAFRFSPLAAKRSVITTGRDRRQSGPREPVTTGGGA